MAFDPSKLVPLLEPPEGFTVWAYTTPDRLQGEVTRAGYFRDARLRRGDFVYVNAQVDSGVVADLRWVSDVQPPAYVTTTRLPR